MEYEFFLFSQDSLAYRMAGQFQLCTHLHCAWCVMCGKKEAHILLNYPTVKKVTHHLQLWHYCRLHSILQSIK